MADLPPLPAVGAKPWTLNPHIQAVNDESTTTAAVINNGRLSPDNLSSTIATATSGKANTADVYSKTASDARYALLTSLAAKANTADVYDKTAADARFLRNTSTPSQVTVSTAGSYTLPTAELIVLTLGASISAVLPSSTLGQGILLYIIQDSTGSRTITWATSGASAVSWPTLGAAPVLAQEAGAVNAVYLLKWTTGWRGYQVE